MFIFCFRVFLFFLSFSLLFSLHTAAASARALDRVIITDEKDDDDEETEERKSGCERRGALGAAAAGSISCEERGR